MNQYRAFVKVCETRSFSKAAEELGYTQSAISQMVKALEVELSTTLLLRSRRELSLTADGEVLLPYIRQIYNSHRELMEKQQEMQGLRGSVIRIGAIASISCNWLPELMRDFKQDYPLVSFELMQGEYTEILQMIHEGSVDFGFINLKAAEGLESVALATDEMLAVLPCNHPFAEKKVIDLSDLVEEPFILLDEGKLSEPLEAFRQHGLTLNVQYRVYDDYTIMAMIEKGMGIGILPELILRRTGYRLLTKKIDPPIVRALGIAYRNKSILPTASKRFIHYLEPVFIGGSAGAANDKEVCPE